MFAQDVIDIKNRYDSNVSPTDFILGAVLDDYQNNKEDRIFVPYAFNIGENSLKIILYCPPQEFSFFFDNYRYLIPLPHFYFTVDIWLKDDDAARSRFGSKGICPISLSLSNLFACSLKPVEISTKAGHTTFSSNYFLYPFLTNINSEGSLCNGGGAFSLDIRNNPKSEKEFVNLFFNVVNKMFSKQWNLDHRHSSTRSETTYRLLKIFSKLYPKKFSSIGSMGSSSHYGLINEMNSVRGTHLFFTALQRTPDIWNSSEFRTSDFTSRNLTFDYCLRGAIPLVFDDIESSS